METQTMEFTKEQKAVQRLANDTGGKLYTDYSGRGMYGDICMGVVIDNSDYEEVLEHAVKLGLKNHRTDSMGLRMIIYFPSVKGYSDDEDEDSEEDD